MPRTSARATKDDEDPPSDGRSARQLDGMRRIQSAAFELFETKGYDAVTVEAIARAAGVGPASIYRNFGSKEGVALWESEPSALFRAVLRGSSAPDFVKLERFAVYGLEALTRGDRDRLRRRTRLLASHPTLTAALAAERTAFRAELTAAILAADAEAGRSSEPVTDGSSLPLPGRMSELEAAVFAGAVCAALDAAIDTWAREEGDVPLHRLLRRAFEHLRRYGLKARRGSARRGRGSDGGDD